MQAEPRACLYKSDQESGRICHAEALSESQNIKIKIQGGGGIQHIDLLKLIQNTQVLKKKHYT